MSAPLLEWPPDRSFRWHNRVIKWGYAWWYRPLVMWFRLRGYRFPLTIGVVFLLGAWGLGSYDQSAQFLIGLANPFDANLDLTNAERSWAIAMRLVGWIVVPATVGSAAGLITAEQMRRLFNQPPKLKDGRLQSALRVAARQAWTHANRSGRSLLHRASQLPRKVRVSDIFEGPWTDQEALICRGFFERHGYHRWRTRRHFRKIFYNLHWQTKAVYDADDRDDHCRTEAFTWVDTLILNWPGGKCPYC
jgi:hypothetical protein